LHGSIQPDDKQYGPDSFGFVKQFLEFVIRQVVALPDEMMLSGIRSGKKKIFRAQARQTDLCRIGRTGEPSRVTIEVAG
jgi:predicted RNA-binding protein YlqC (UPF0109 family)